MKRVDSNIYSDLMETQYQVALKELKNNNSDLQEKFEKLSKVIEDEWKDTTTNSEFPYEFTITSAK